MKKKLISGVVAAMFALLPCASFGAMGTGLDASGGQGQMMYGADQGLSATKAAKSHKKKSGKKATKKKSGKSKKGASKKKTAIEAAPKF